VAKLEKWQQELVVPDAEWVDEGEIARELCVGNPRVTYWIIAGRLQHAFNAAGQSGATRASVEALVRFRREASMREKFVRALGTAIRNMWP
jgi:hypothetical protein